jgi:hypothetical protein
VMYSPTASTVGWLKAFRRPDTRTVAAEWLKSHAPAGARVAVENSGPTYLDAAGLHVVGTELIAAHPLDWYRQRADYLVISAADVSQDGEYLGAGPMVFQIAPTPQRWGPPIRIVRLRN